MPKASIFEERYKKLNKAQKKAVDTTEGPVLVVAGPGSGKTEILSLRVANIIQKTDTPPGGILCLTFTDSAAVNMRRRLSGLIGPAAYRVGIFTFHSFASSIIERYPEYFYGGARFLPADELTTKEVFEHIFSGLSHDSPFLSTHNGEYVYIRDVARAIEELKKSGVTPDILRSVLDENEASLEKINEIIRTVFEARLSVKEFGNVATALERIEKIDTGKDLPSPFKPLSRVVALSLSKALEVAYETGKAAPLSQWKSKWTKKNTAGERVFKDTEHASKLRALADVYESYRSEMHSRGYFDFNDMLLDVIEACTANPALLSEIQEQYQYVLVDEFQDTNDAQMRLIRFIADASVYEGRPNVMVVGDDDQAVYKFQGAELSNILEFKELYPDAEVVVMTENYRSHQNILDLARYMIQKGEDRLENRVPEIHKELRASNPIITETEGEVRYSLFPSSSREYVWVAQKVRELLDSGADPKEIAIISRKHKTLEALLPYFSRERIPVSYERKQNVFEEPHIRQLVQMARFVVTVARKDKEEADELLPEILSYPFWGIDRKTVWEISSMSVRDEKYKKLWIERMLSHEDPNVREVAEFLLELSRVSFYEPLENVLDMMIGSHVELSSDDEEENISEKTASKNIFHSPFKEYYFSRERFEKDRLAYLSFLSGLRVFVGALREYKRGSLISLGDMVVFADTHEKNRITLPDTSPFVSSENAVTLLTAHRAKGLEFGTVFVVSCQEEVWAGRGIPEKISFPANMPIRQAGDTRDDHLRLFYVALTRARSQLYLSSHEKHESGKNSSVLEFLVPEGGETGFVRDILAGVSETSVDVDSSENVFHILESFHATPFLEDERAILFRLVEDYRMSATHFNNFLDVSRGGPVKFLEQNLLRFPQAKVATGKYGSAVHATIERVYTYLRREGVLPDLQAVLGWFSGLLEGERMNPREYAHFEKRGHEKLTTYYEKRKRCFDPSHIIEKNFIHEGVVVGDASITGKIDKIVPEGGGMSVYDLKTGKAFVDWDRGTPEEKLKLYKYKNQLIFYKLLVEGSREFGGKYAVHKGVIEFVEDSHGDIVELPLEITDEDTERVKRLVVSLYKHICALDFPDVGDYTPDLNGMKAFEEFLLQE